MAKKPGYWDMHRCAWVTSEPDDMGLPVPKTPAAEAMAPAAEATVPEQRPDLDAPLVAGTPD